MALSRVLKTRTSAESVAKKQSMQAVNNQGTRLAVLNDEPLSASAAWDGMQAIGEQGVRVLRGSQAWLRAVAAFHEKIRAELHPTRRNFLLPKPDSWFGELLDGNRGVILAVMAQGGALGGMLAVVSYSDIFAAKGGGSITYPDQNGTMARLCGKHKASVIQSVSVAATQVGKGLSSKLMSAGVDYAKTHASTPNVLAQMATANFLSWLRFMAHGFAIIGTWDGEHSRFVLRHINDAERKVARNNSDSICRTWAQDYCNMDEVISEIREYVSKGYLVFSEPSEDLRLIFAKID